jgi:hypothetical protein
MSQVKDIVNELKTLLSAISVDAGYATDLGENIKEDDGIFELIDDGHAGWLQAIIFWESPEDIEENGGIWKRTLPLELGIVATGKTSLDIAYDAITDVYKAIGLNQSLNGKAHRVRATNHQIVREHDNHTMSLGQISLEIVYATPAWNF